MESVQKYIPPPCTYNIHRMMAKDTIRKNYRIPKKTLEDIEFIINNSTARTETDAIILSLKKYTDELRSEKSYQISKRE